MLIKSKMLVHTLQERIPPIVHQLHIQSSDESYLSLVYAVLLNIGYKEGDWVVSAVKNKPSIELFNEDPVKLERVALLFKSLKLQGIKVSQRRLLPRHWLTKWKNDWKPAVLTKRLDVVPVWYKDKYQVSKGRDFILMDTLLSFGTGLHETTQCMARFIESQEGCFRSFLDIGTGTGILAFVAMKYGACDVTGIDIGALSVQAAKDNMKANQLYFNVHKADIKKYAFEKCYDFVAANLITEDLIMHASKIVACVKMDGFLAVSGISLENLPKLQKAFLALPLTRLKLFKGKQWAGILYQKMRS